MAFSRTLQQLALLLALGAPCLAQAEHGLIVSAGDTLTSVAQANGVSVADLRRWNALDSDHLKVGQRLQVDGPRVDFSGPVYEVRGGQTLSTIAGELGVSLSSLVELNPGLDPDRIRKGQVLNTGPAHRRVRYEVQPGETLSMIAVRYETSVKAILRENSGLRPNRIRSGQYISVVTEVPDSYSESLGSPNAGRLKNGALLPRHRGYVIRDAERAWGTNEVVHGIHSAFVRLARKFPKSPKIEVHDISRRSGGFLEEHRSHQSGRDADLAYFRKRCPRNVCDFSKAKPSTLDEKRQWALIEPWLRAGIVESMFVDYSLQKPLYREARRRGATRKELELWFQYPRGRSSAMGVVRHFKSHADHLHVRFACHDTDEECRTLRPAMMQAQQQYVSTVRR